MEMGYGGGRMIMNIKMLWFDTETTGLDPILNDIIQISGQITINGQVMEEFNMKCQPTNWDNIQQGALDINKITIEQLKTYPQPELVYNKLLKMFKKYVNPFDKTDKFVAAGQNVKFDIDMTQQFFKKHNDPYFFSFIHAGHFDTLHIAIMLEIKEKRKIFTKGYKLSQMCEALGIKLEDAHDALNDIRATRELAKVMWNRLTKYK